MGDMALRPIRQQAITRVLPLLLVTIALASNTNLFAMSGSQRNTATPSPPPFATANATATGTVLVMWGDPYLPVQISDGNGTLTVSLQGNVAQRPDLQSAYTYTDPYTWGDMDVNWSTANETYSADVYFYQGHSPYNKTTVFPYPANSFAAMYIYYTGELAVNGVTSQVHGLAAIIDAEPGFFGFRGTARAISVVLYSMTYHGNQFVFRWSQTDQTINGIEQPMSRTCESSVRLFT